MLFGDEYEEIPHGDTINNYFKNVSVDDIRRVMYGLVRDILKKKILNDYRIKGKYYHFIIDGVNMYSFYQNHIEGSIVKKHNEDKHIIQICLSVIWLWVM